MNTTLSFSNTEVAFKHKNKSGLKKAELLFKSFNFPILLRVGPAMAKIAVAMGMKGFIKSTIFAQFCGGESIQESLEAVKMLASRNVGTILDYSVEGEENEAEFDKTCSEIIKTIEVAANDDRIPFSVFKTTGIIRFALLEKVNNGTTLTENESQEWKKGKARFEKICNAAAENKVRLFVDAEETWIQDAIDRLTEEMMEKHNSMEAIVFNTIQMYRHDRLNYLIEQIRSTTYFLGFKIVRGAYMEKERLRASEMGYPSPIQPDKAACDKDYNEAIRHCIEHIDRVSICAGSHNEESCLYLVDLMNQKNIQSTDKRVYFSQLLGMSDHISFNLANAGYNVAKYVPYGPVISVIPYLTRRAQENSSVSGQVGRELKLIHTELMRRNSLSKTS